jgi:DNA (cytosine-5)-methyltransferase 1
MRIGSLFSGIGGLELGLEWSGVGHTVWQVEREPFCRAVLAKHWPAAERFDDVRTVGKANLAPVDLICGGFPCQDVSSAGKGAGLAGERSGLWREFARILWELQPGWVVVENVAGGARRWVNAILRELESLGYACLPIPLSASDVGAPHRRARIFVVAHLDGRRKLQPQGGKPEQRERAADGAIADAQREPVRLEQGRVGRAGGAGPAKSGDASKARDASDAHDSRRERAVAGEVEERPGLASHAGWSPQPELVPLVHGLSGGLVGRRRRARIRALGNSVVPQQAEVVGWVIRELLGGAS